jgi:hypothetical protein
MERRHVGIDLHRRQSMIFVMNSAGEKLSCVPIGNEPLRLLEEVSRTGDDAEVVVEATYGWYWAVDLLQENGYSVHLASSQPTRRPVVSTTSTRICGTPLRSVAPSHRWCWPLRCTIASTRSATVTMNGVFGSV